jgi:hypothetical protein
MLYFQQFTHRPEIVKSWVLPATKYVRRSLSTARERHDTLAVPEEARNIHRSWQQYLIAGERWASEIVTAVELNASGMPLSSQAEARNVPELYKRFQEAGRRANRETSKLIESFALVVD